jgi:hypothetical protein
MIPTPNTKKYCHTLHYYSNLDVILLYVVTYLSDSRRGFGLDIGFTDHFNTQLVITLNYSTITNFHTL